MWYVDYQKVREKANKTKGLYDPFLRLITVMERGIYFKKFTKTWKDIDPRAEENLAMTKLFELPISNPITTSMIERNQSLVAVAYKNLTVEVIDINSAKKNGLNFMFNSVRFDARFKYGVEEDHQVLAIGHIPASDFLIFSSNRFEIIKADRRAGKIENRAKNPIDKIGILAFPCLSHRTEQDPFNPNSTKDPEISEKHIKMGHKKYFIAVGADDPMNVVMDWTTLKPVKFFSMHLAFIRGKSREDNIIGSITYYGGIPLGHFYVLSTKGPSAYVFLYSQVTETILQELSWDIVSPNKEVSWIYATTYVSIFFPSPVSQGGNPLLKIVSLHGDRHKTPQDNPLLDSLQSNQVNKFEMLKFDLELGRLPSEPQFYLEKYYGGLEILFLAVYNRSNSIKVEPPSVLWDHCRRREGLPHRRSRTRFRFVHVLRKRHGLSLAFG